MSNTDDLPPVLQFTFGQCDERNRDMITFYTRPEYKEMFLKLARRSPLMNMSAYLRYMVSRELYRAGFIDQHGNPIPQAPPNVPEAVKPVSDSRPTFTPDEDEGRR